MIKIDTLYVDLDGVLVDFELGIYTIIHDYTGRKRDKIDKDTASLLDDMSDALADIGYERAGELLAIPKYKEAIRKIIGMEPDWWTNLKWMPDGKELWEAIKIYKPIILSSPLNKTKWNEKNTWVDRELGKDVKVFIEDDKEVYAKPGALLIDDRPQHSQFEEQGGTVIKHVNTRDTIRQLANFDLSALEHSSPVQTNEHRHVHDFTTFVNEHQKLK